jgi:hypothetical protein
MSGPGRASIVCIGVLLVLGALGAIAFDGAPTASVESEDRQSESNADNEDGQSAFNAAPAIIAGSGRSAHQRAERHRNGRIVLILFFVLCVAIAIGTCSLWFFSTRDPVNTCCCCCPLATDQLDFRWQRAPVTSTIAGPPSPTYGLYQANEANEPI